jgi:hypothetical protein
MKDKGLRKILTESGLIRGDHYQIDGSGLHLCNFQPASRDDVAQLEKNQKLLMNGFNALIIQLGLGIRNKRIFHEVSDEVDIYKLPKQKGKKK